MIKTDQEFSIEIGQELIRHDTTRIERLQELKNYYLNKTAILNRTMPDDKPNNKISHNYAGYIVDMVQGYFMGNPVSYSSDNEQAMERLQGIFDANDEQDQNSELSKDAGIHGVAYELLYVDEERNVKFDVLDPKQVIMVYDTSIDPEPLFAIHYYKISRIGKSEDVQKAFVYDKDFVVEYEIVGTRWKVIEERPHFFGEVPVNPVYNNDEGLGDFERVMSLIDAYNSAVSNKINDLDYFTDAILGIYGATLPDDIDLKNNRMLEFPGDGADARWIMKPSNDTEAQNMMSRTKEDIHKFSFCPDLTDEQFAGNISGEAMKYKLMGLENLAGNKERKFKTALMRRIRLIFSWLENANQGSFNANEIQLTFTRNKPVNEKEAVETALLLRQMISEEKALAYLPMVDDPRAEIEARERALDGLMDVDEDVEVEVGEVDGD